MRTVETALKLLEDIEQYYSLSDTADSVLKSFLCIFTEKIRSPEHFSDLFWAFMQTVHDIDSLTHAYDPSVSSDPSLPNFELSFRGRAAFPTSLHSASPRLARQYAHPGWALNQSAQFNSLRTQGLFEDWQRKIRNVDSKFDPSGLPNPLLVDHGAGPAGAQLGGVRMDRYPFVARRIDDRPMVVSGLIARAIAEEAPIAVIDHLRTLARKIESTDLLPELGADVSI
jgi:FPC/CPF motif-containing protein YcgG